jgi:hypothetical protein
MKREWKNNIDKQMVIINTPHLRFASIVPPKGIGALKERQG